MLDGIKVNAGAVLLVFLPDTFDMGWDCFSVLPLSDEAAVNLASSVEIVPAC